MWRPSTRKCCKRRRPPWPPLLGPMTPLHSIPLQPICAFHIFVLICAPCPYFCLEIFACLENFSWSRAKTAGAASAGASKRRAQRAADIHSSSSPFSSSDEGRLPSPPAARAPKRQRPALTRLVMRVWGCCAFACEFALVYESQILWLTALLFYVQPPPPTPLSSLAAISRDSAPIETRPLPPDTTDLLSDVLHSFPWLAEAARARVADATRLEFNPAGYKSNACVRPHPLLDGRRPKEGTLVCFLYVKHIIVRASESDVSVCWESIGLCSLASGAQNPSLNAIGWGPWQKTCVPTQRLRRRLGCGCVICM